jgi:hypothetical protein
MDIAVTSTIDACDAGSTAGGADAMAAGAVIHKLFHSYTTTA